MQNENLAVQGRVVFNSGLKIKNKDLHQSPLSDDALKKLQTRINTLIQSLKEKSQKLKGTNFVSTAYHLGKGRTVILLIQHDNVRAVILDERKQEITQYISVPELQDIDDSQVILSDRGETCIEKGTLKNLYNERQEKMLTSLEGYLNNPARAGPNNIEGYTIDDDIT